MVRTLSSVVSAGLSKVVVELQLVSEELTGDVQELASDHGNLLAVQQLLGDDGGQTTQQVALSVDDDNWFEVRHVASEEKKCWEIFTHSGAPFRAGGTGVRDTALQTVIFHLHGARI